MKKTYETQANNNNYNVSGNIIKLWKNNNTRILNPIHYGLFNKPNLMGGRSAHVVIWLLEDIFKILFNRGLVLDEKGQNKKAQPFYLKNCSPENFLKNHQIWQKSWNVKNSLFGNQTFHPKNARRNQTKASRMLCFFVKGP